MASTYPAWIKGRRFFVNISDVCPAIWPLSRVFHVKQSLTATEVLPMEQLMIGQLLFFDLAQFPIHIFRTILEFADVIYFFKS